MNMRVGIIGIGNMGSRLAKKFLSAGVDVGVFDVNQHAVNDLVQVGATSASTPADLARNYSKIITILPNSEIVKKTLFDRNGLVEGFHRESVLIEMTTSIPSVTKEIARIIEERGYQMVDAPVSGGITRAAEGTLTIMVGGKEEVFSEVLPLLEIIGSNIVHVGGIGAGHTIKVLNNLISATTLVVTGEALALGTKMGLQPNKMLEVINTSTGKSHSSEYKFPTQILPRKFDGGFSLELMVKDLTIALGIAQEEKTPMFLSSASYQLWKYAISKNAPDADHMEVIKTIEEIVGAELRESSGIKN